LGSINLGRGTAPPPPPSRRGYVPVMEMRLVLGVYRLIKMFNVQCNRDYRVQKKDQNEESLYAGTVQMRVESESVIRK